MRHSISVWVAGMSEMGLKALANEYGNSVRTGSTQLMILLKGTVGGRNYQVAGVSRHFAGAKLCKNKIGKQHMEVETLY